MKQDEPGVSILSILRMLRRSKKVRPVVEMSTCGHCKTQYDVHKGHMCSYIKDLFAKMEKS
ncbi:hypothetical protein SEA_EVY_124 [Streptomyces phage Evy]|uniref:Uncharacterized protein n=1 Tax=Streptomyces phage Evy TaxID=2588514 RepID=A0A514DK53_9CAUD|nr:hypothetical protein KNU67_gp148 [Streptomyces phage Evy]QDH93984.1 hypothetical protein SEA_EVY_124 [Streptomyces phage Evy]UEM46905.1 hypothetical protein SEA_TARGARYEN_127 [Streptomyces phage Targaryen]